jgi:hypothetical protein
MQKFFIGEEIKTLNKKSAVKVGQPEEKPEPTVEIATGGGKKGLFCALMLDYLWKINTLNLDEMILISEENAKPVTDPFNPWKHQ